MENGEINAIQIQRALKEVGTNSSHFRFIFKSILLGLQKCEECLPTAIARAHARREHERVEELKEHRAHIHIVLEALRHKQGAVLAYGGTVFIPATFKEHLTSLSQ